MYLGNGIEATVTLSDVWGVCHNLVTAFRTERFGSRHIEVGGHCCPIFIPMQYITEVMSYISLQ